MQAKLALTHLQRTCACSLAGAADEFVTHVLSSAALSATLESKTCYHVAIPIQKGLEELVALQVLGPKCAHLDTPNTWCAEGVPLGLEVTKRSITAKQALSTTSGHDDWISSVAVSSGNTPQMSQAVFLPLPAKKETTGITTSEGVEHGRNKLKLSRALMLWEWYGQQFSAGVFLYHMQLVVLLLGFCLQWT